MEPHNNIQMFATTYYNLVVSSPILQLMISQQIQKIYSWSINKNKLEYKNSLHFTSFEMKISWSSKSLYDNTFYLQILSWITCYKITTAIHLRRILNMLFIFSKINFLNCTLLGKFTIQNSTFCNFHTFQKQ
jgi:hypothetical protein